MCGKTNCRVSHAGCDVDFGGLIFSNLTLPPKHHLFHAASNLYLKYLHHTRSRPRGQLVRKPCEPQLGSSARMHQCRPAYRGHRHEGQEARVASTRRRFFNGKTTFARGESIERVTSAPSPPFPVRSLSPSLSRVRIQPAKDPI